MKFLLQLMHKIIRLPPQMHHKNCNYELIIKNINLKLQQKFCTKSYHIISLLYRSSHVESSKIGFLILLFFKYSAKINLYLYLIIKRHET
jgi:hypothetical protein